VNTVYLVIGGFVLAIFWIAWFQTRADDRRFAADRQAEREAESLAYRWQVYSESRAAAYFAEQDS
jgi:hypothetical protein